MVACSGVVRRSHRLIEIYFLDISRTREDNFQSDEGIATHNAGDCHVNLIQIKMLTGSNTKIKDTKAQVIKV